MQKITLTLPICELKCSKCGHQWMNATPLWDRGHVLADRGNAHIFVSDDVRTVLGECLDFAPILEPLGFTTQEKCPQCHAFDVIVPYPANVMGKKDLECIEFTAEDFVKSSQREWQLTDCARNALQGSYGTRS